MSLRGGYQIIDLKMKEFSSSLENYYRFPELFEDVKNGNAKMIILSGLNLDGVKYRDYEILIYEVNETDTPMYYQAILRRMWNTRDYKVITKYLNIYPDDRVNMTMEENIYEILPDGSLSLTSENAVQNKVITEKINEIDLLNSKQTSRINELNNGDYTPVVANGTYNIPLTYSNSGSTASIEPYITFTKIGNIVTATFDVSGEDVNNFVNVASLGVSGFINSFKILDSNIFGKEYEVIDFIKLNMGYSNIDTGAYIGTTLTPYYSDGKLRSRISPLGLTATQNDATTVQWSDIFEGVGDYHIVTVRIVFLVYNDDVTSLGD